MNLKKIFSFLLIFCINFSLAKANTNPPNYINMDTKKMDHLGFKYDFSKNGEKVFFRLEYPSEPVKNYFPHSSVLVIKTKSGSEIIRSTTWVSKNIRYIDLQFNMIESDVDISLIYSCETEKNLSCGPGIKYGIKSLSSLLKNL